MISLRVMWVVWVTTGSGLGLVWELYAGMGVNWKWSKISLGLVWVSTGSDMGLVWGSCGGCGGQPEVVWD